MLKKILVIFLYILLIFAFAFGIWYLTKINGWPLWVGGSIFAGVVGIVLGIVFLRRYLLRSNEKKFVQRVIAQEGEAVFVSDKDDSLFISELEKQWEKSIKILYGSKLNKGKNPIYALPWVMVIGESGSGKTSLIKNSRLSSAATDVEASSQYAGTKNCDWWFFENAVILDTAGRYSIPIEEKRDNAEWKRFLSLLAKYRKEEPLNALVVTISADRLLENDKDIIQNDALSIRKRIDQLMMSVGAKFPVYLMVTKMDYLYGFSEFCENLPDELHAQAMGYLNEGLNQNWQEVLSDAIEFIKQKIINIQLLSVKQGSKQSKEILLFTKEFDKIIPALKSFSSIVFGDNPYQKIPMLRGIYFSSALSDGEAKSEFFTKFNLPKHDAKPKNKAYFIEDFFRVIIPSDRNIFTPIKEYLSWQRRNYKIAVAAWLFIFVSVVGMYSYSYIQNLIVIGDMKNIEKFNEDFKHMDMTSRIIAFDKLRLNILKIEKLNNNKMIPFLNFKQSKQAEINLKKLFHERFNEFIYRDFLFRIERSIDKITNKTPSNEVVSYIGFLIDSANFLRDVLDGKKDLKATKLFSNWIQNVLFQEESKIDPSVAFLFVDNYVAFQNANTDKEVIKEQIKIYKNLIYKIVNEKGSNLHWLTDKEVSQTDDITIKTFFKNMNESKIKYFPHISGALSKKGRQNLQKDIDILVEAMDNNEELKKNLKSFWDWYNERFYYRWKNFATSFAKAQAYLTPQEKEEIIYAMASDKNPYFDFIHVMASEFRAYNPLEKFHPWTKSVIELDDIMSIAKEIRKSKDSLLAKVGTEKDKFIAEVDKDKYVKKIKSAGLFDKYLDDILKLSNVVDKKQSKILLSDFFAQNTDKTPPSPSFNQCHNHYKQFIHSLKYRKTSEFVYNLVEGPKDLIVSYAIKQTGDILNEQWQNNVIGMIPISSGHNLLLALFDKKRGLVWKYINKELKPFVKLNRYGYSIKEVSGYKLDISPSFLKFINSAINVLSAYKPQYDISITTLPFDVNKDAKIRPLYVDLHLRCAKADYLLRNENYSLTKKFSWIPKQCGDTILTFGFDSFQLKKTYKGKNGFLYFLKDFQDGTKSFRLGDFDKVAPELKQNNVTFIRLDYNIVNMGNILKLLDKTPYEIPQKVVGR